MSTLDLKIVWRLEYPELKPLQRPVDEAAGLKDSEGSLEEEEGSRKRKEEGEEVESFSVATSRMTNDVVGSPRASAKNKTKSTMSGGDVVAMEGENGRDAQWVEIDAFIS